MEEGQIEDDSDEGYAIITRPDVPTPVSVENQQQHTQLDTYSDKSSEDEGDSDTDSSDSNTFRRKRPKVKVDKCPIARSTSYPLQANKRKKYDIWSQPLQEQVLTETLGNFGVDLDDKMDRSVESYNYKLGYLYNQPRNEQAASRIFDNNGDDIFEETFDKKDLGGKRKKNVKERLGQKKKKKSKKNSWQLRKLNATPDDDPHIIAEDIADGLKETKLFLISRVVELFGNKRAIELYNETRRIEADGGMLVLDQSRRRTPGGVFLNLVYNDGFMDKDEVRAILNEGRKSYTRRRKKLIALKRRKKTQAVKEELISSGLLKNDLSDLLIKTELKEEEEEFNSELPEEHTSCIKVEMPEEINDEQTLTNPPPSPATDQDTPTPLIEREFVKYEVEDGEYLDIETEMELL